MQNVGEIIASQVGKRAFFMLGARDLVSSHKEKSLTFKIGRNAKTVSHIRITLTPADLYRVEALRVRKKNLVPECKVVETMDDVFVDSLHAVIEALTGMRTSL